MEDYRPNSHKSKEEPEKRVKAPVVKNAKQKKKSGLREIIDTFIPEDKESFKSYILLGVIAPLIKKGISNVVDAILYGGTSSEKKSTASKVSYRSYYEKDRDDDRARYAPRITDTNILTDSREEAEAIISGLEDIIDAYGFASVADMFDLANLEHNHTDNKYGWTSVKNARIVPYRDGWEIQMPKRMPIDG